MNRNRAKIFLLSVAALLLSACATQAQLQYQQMSTNMEQTKNVTDACQANMEKNDAYQRLAQTLILKDNDVEALKKMMINRYATKEEKEDLIEVYALLESCRSIVLKGMEKVHPDYVALYSSFFAEDDEISLRLLKDEITIGRANELYEKMLVELIEKHTAVAKALGKWLDDSHYAEMEIIQRNSAALQQTLYQQQLLRQNQQAINAARQPVRTNCNAWGNSINCRSY